MLSEINEDTIAAEVMLQRSGSRDSVIVLVEGPSDEVFYSRIFGNICTIFVISFGKKNSDGAIRKLNKSSKISGYVAIRDRDFDLLVKKEILKNRLCTDWSDTTSFLFFSPAFRKALESIVGLNSISAIESKIGNSIIDVVIKSSILVGYIRFSAEKLGISVRLKDFEFKFVRRNPFVIDRQKLHAGVKERIKADSFERQTVLDQAIKLEEESFDHRELCCGHDMAKSLARILKAFSSADTVRQMDWQSLESVLLAAYEVSFFSDTTLYKEISNWLQERDFPELNI